MVSAKMEDTSRVQIKHITFTHIRQWEFMDVFEHRNKLIVNFSDYIASFIRIRGERLINLGGALNENP